MLSASAFINLGPTPPRPTELLWKLNKIVFIKCGKYSRCSTNVTSLQNSPEKGCRDRQNCSWCACYMSPLMSQILPFSNPAPIPRVASGVQTQA